ncbi:MAG: hypothetical protein KDK76_03120, partial [Chlamydiia bacterium]|nr:hypothetical protein [Chlamydiia bacterium]
MFVTPITGPTVSFYHTSEERIQKAIQEKDYGRALDLMILLCNQEEVEDPLLLFLYEHAFLILSELSPDQFTRFQSLFLPNLLRNSPHLVEKQHDLAQALGNFFFNQEKATPSSYKISLHYWVLANHLSTKGNLHSCLDLTPIFTSFIEKRLINEEPFRKTCAYLTASGNLDGLTKTWHKGKELTPFFPKLLFQILHEQGEKGHAERLTNSCQKTFAPIAKEIIMGFFENQQKEDLNSTLAQRWRSFLEKYRAAFEEDDSDLKTYQHNLTKAFKERFFVPLIEDALFFLGLPPCGFDIRAMGSLARNELSKTSDLEYFILIEKEEHLPYFKTLASFLELQFIALGETKLPQDFPTFSALGDFSGGIHIDIGGNPLVNDSIATPRTLAQSFFSGGEEAYEPNSLSHTLMRSTSLYSQGKDLFSPFNEEITKRLDENINGKSRRVNRYKAHKQKRILDFESSHRFTNFKTQYIEPLFHLLSDLGILYRIQEANTLDIIDALHGKKVFSQQGTSFLKQSVSLLYHMRLGKTPKDENLLSQIEQRAIKPLYGFIKKDLDLAQLSPGNKTYQPKPSYSQEPTAPTPYLRTPPQPMNPERKFIQLPQNKLVEVKQKDLSKNNQEKIDSIRSRLMDEIERSFLTAQDSKAFEDKENLEAKIKELKTTLLSDRDPFREVINRYDQRYLKLLQKPKETPTPTILPLYVPSDYYVPDPQERAREKAEVNLGYAREIERVKNYYSSQGIWTDHD